VAVTGGVHRRPAKPERRMRLSMPACVRRSADGVHAAGCSGVDGQMQYLQPEVAFSQLQ
jgi:hypothetical protein